MPVADSPTHDKMKIEAGKPYGCWGRPRLPTLVNLGPGPGVRPFRMSRDCRSDSFLKNDPRCAGCPTQKDIEYLKEKGLLVENEQGKERA